jgi:hypothetical protein
MMPFASMALEERLASRHLDEHEVDLRGQCAQTCLLCAGDDHFPALYAVATCDRWQSVRMVVAMNSDDLACAVDLSVSAAIDSQVFAKLERSDILDLDRIA